MRGQRGSLLMSQPDTSTTPCLAEAAPGLLITSDAQRLSLFPDLNVTTHIKGDVKSRLIYLKHPTYVVLCNANANATRMIMITISWKLAELTSEDLRLNPLHQCSESMQIADCAFLLFIISHQCRFRAGMEHKTLAKLSAA